MTTRAASANLAHAKQLVADAGYTPSPESWEDEQMGFCEAFSVEPMPGTGPRRAKPAFVVRYWKNDNRTSIDGVPRAKGAKS